MSRLYARSGRRFLQRHPGQLGLALVGIALGVAVVVGVDLANDSARRAFELSSALVTGRTTHQLVGVDGTLPERVYAQLRREARIHRAAPVIEAGVRLPRLPDRSFTLLGVDPFSESPVRDEVTHRAGRIDLARFLTVPRTVALPEPLADTLGASIGSRSHARRRRARTDRRSRGHRRSRRRTPRSRGQLPVCGHRDRAGIDRPDGAHNPHRPRPDCGGDRGPRVAADSRNTAARGRVAGHGHRRDDPRLPDQSDGTQPARPIRRDVPDLLHAVLPGSAATTRRRHGPGARPHAEAIVRDDAGGGDDARRPGYGTGTGSRPSAGRGAYRPRAADDRGPLFRGRDGRAA